MRKKTFLILLAVVILLLVASALGFFTWVGNQRQAMPFAISSLVSDAEISVQTDPWLVFAPTGDSPKVGLVIYPGGLVDYKAYAPTARTVSAAGYLVVIPPMPLNLAVFDFDVAAEIIAAYPKIDHWAVGGHSLGGAMAARFIDQNPGKIEGLVLWASYPAESNDLSATDLTVTSIYGTLDGVAEPDVVLASRSLLPKSTTWVPIMGGNHAQFGWYGSQEGDNPATINREEQGAQIVTGTIELLSLIDR
jgi:dienelactone hydrolase